MTKQPLESIDAIRDDEDLSALLDGELSPEREVALRRRLADDKALALRLAEMGALTGELSSLAERDVEVERIDRMQAALRARIGETDPAAGEASEAEIIPLTRSLRRGIPMAVALAASLALYLAFGRSPIPQQDAGVEFAEAPREVAISAEDADPPVATSEDSLIAAVKEDVVARGGPEGGGRLEDPTEAPRRVAGGDAVALPVPGSSKTVASEIPLEALAEFRDEEIAIAFEYEMLVDYEVIENLELLELIDSMDSAERI